MREARRADWISWWVREIQGLLVDLTEPILDKAREVKTIRIIVFNCFDDYRIGDVLREFDRKVMEGKSVGGAVKERIVSFIDLRDIVMVQGGVYKMNY